MIEFEHELDALHERIGELKNGVEFNSGPSISQELDTLQLELEARTADVFSKLTPWQRVQLARHPKRPHTNDLIGAMLTGFTELHGDRHHGDDPAIVAGLAYLHDKRVVVVGHQKGRTTNENVERNFGMAHPEGYRKALRLFALAERFNLPVLTFLDTPGASPTLDDEERGQSWAISENMAKLAGLRVPIIVSIIGEGGSGGALAIGVGDRILMLEHAIYSVASPEAAASIIWRDAKFAENAAAALRLTAEDLYAMGLVDRVVREPPGGAHRDFAATAKELSAAIVNALGELQSVDRDELVEARYTKFKNMSIHTSINTPSDG